MKILLAIAALVLLLISLAFWYRWDSARNRGYKFGYYGQFNTVSNALSRIAGVTITNAWHNADVTLEEFGFDVLWNGKKLDVFFGERDAVRKLSGAELEEALRKRLYSEATNGPAN